MAAHLVDAVGVAAWYACSFFAFWLAMRAHPGREQTGRTLVGIGALFMATSLVLPTEPPAALPPVVMALLVLGSGVSLIFGLLLCFPRRGLKSVLAEEQSDSDSDPAGSEPKETPEDPDGRA